MKKIVLAGFPNVKNLGDPVLFESTEYLIKSIVYDNLINIVHLDLFGEKNKGITNIVIKVLNKLLNLLFKKESRNTKYFYRVQKYLIELSIKNYYKSKIIDADAIIFAGGGMIKYKYETCDFRLTILTEMANSLNIPVAFNAVGVEGYDQDNVRCQNMKKAMNLGNVNLITTRDDIELLNEKYIVNSNIKTYKVADSAFWSNKVYGVVKNTDSGTIGLGVVRGGIFNDNGIELTEQELLELWCQIINELDTRGIKWRLFTNGLDADNQFMDLLLSKTNRKGDKDLLTIIPRTSKELVEIIASFNKIIACRMHASIIAYSLDVPSIGLIWNNKIRMFGEIIGHPDRFIAHQEFDAERIVNKLLKIEISSEDIKFKNDFRETTYETLKRFISTI